MKTFLTVFFLLFCFCSFSQDYFDEKPHSIGLVASPFEVVVWNRLPYNTRYVTKPERVFLSWYSPAGFLYQYELNYFLKICLGAQYSSEHLDYQQSDFGGQNVWIDYDVRYLEVPVAVRFYPWHVMVDEEIHGGFFLQAGGNFDFVIKEDIYKETSPVQDPFYGIPPVTITETHSNELRFHKFCASVFIGHEIVFDDVTFFYGGRIETQPLFQLNILQENGYKNRSFSLINIGLNYRF